MAVPHRQPALANWPCKLPLIIRLMDHVEQIPCDHTSSDRKARKQLRQQEKRRRNERRVQTHWHALPVDILERILAKLSIKERHVASQVCFHWFESFYSPRVWSSFTLTDTTFTKRKYNYYMGYQRMIDPYKTQVAYPNDVESVENELFCLHSFSFNVSATAFASCTSNQ